MQVRALTFIMFSMAAGLRVPGFALRFMLPGVTSGAILASQAVFEGVVVDVLPSGPLFLRAAPHSAVFRFRVLRGWKGVQTGVFVDILRDTGLGDGFTEGCSYLVIAETRVQGILQAGAGGFSMPLEYAAKSLAFLKKHFAENGEAGRGTLSNP